jgi:hypothetical protein
MLVRRALVLCALSACVKPTGFVCALDADCNAGHCEATHYCSFDDSSCTTQPPRRYGQYAGDLSNQCVAGVGPDAAIDGPTSDGGTPAGCGKISMFTDDFAAGSQLPQWNASFQVTNVMYAFSNGQVRFTIAGNGYAGLDETVSYDMTGDRAWVHAVQVPGDPGAPGPQMFLKVYNDDVADNSLYMGFEGNTLECEVVVAGNTTQVCNLTYSASAHQWWQIRQSGSNVIFEASADGSTFNQVASVANPFELTHMHYQLLAGSYNGPGSVPAIFDDVNGGVASTMKYCPASTPTDDFSGASRSTLWGDWSVDTGVTLSQSGGVLSITPPASTAGMRYGTYETGNAYDLTGSTVRVKVPAMVNAFACDEAALGVNDWITGNAFGLDVDNGRIACSQQVSGTTTQLGADQAYSSVSDLYWRLREQAGSVYCETSADGVTWNMIGSPGSSSTIGVTKVQLELTAGTCASVATPGTAQFDNFNLP